MRKYLIAMAALLFTSAASAQGSGTGKAGLDGPHLGLHHAAITVSDIDATVAFYSKAVPFNVVQRYKVKGSTFPAALLSARHKEIEIAIVSMPTGFIQLMDFEPGKVADQNLRPVIGPGYTHICFQSSSKDPAIKRFKAAGLSVISRFGKEDGVDIGGYGVRYAYGRDPDGIMIENESLDAPKRSEAAWITHIANVVHDRDTMLEFYARLLGRKAHRTIEQENRPRLDDVANLTDSKIKGGWFTVGNMDIEVWEFVRPKTPLYPGKRKLDEIGYNSFGLEVSDLKMEKQRLKSIGVELAGKTMSVGGWRIQYAYDPEGNLFSVLENMSLDQALSVTSLPR
jgi:catechol 2,3-dioxygenase-like lactoylglutathione lyase family enzyme